MFFKRLMEDFRLMKTESSPLKKCTHIPYLADSNTSYDLKCGPHIRNISHTRELVGNVDAICDTDETCGHHAK